MPPARRGPSSGGVASAQKKNSPCDCCDPDVDLPETILQREDFCDVNSHNRKCTDVLCCLVFLAVLACWGVVFFIGTHYGKLESLVYARDYRGRLCGVEQFENQTLTYYPRLKDDLIQYAFDTIDGFSLDNLDALLAAPDLDVENLRLTGICVEQCPRMSDLVCTPDYLESHTVPDPADVAQCYGDEVLNDPSVELLLLSGLGDIPRNRFFNDNPELCSSCWNVVVNTTEIFFRCFDVITKIEAGAEVCVYPDMRNVNATLADGLTPNPKFIAADDAQCLAKRVVEQSTSVRPTYENPLAELLGDTMSTLASWGNDALNAAWVIFLVGVVGSIACGFLWIVTLRVCTKCVVWGTICGFSFLLACAAAYCWLMTGYFDTATVAEWVSAAAASIGFDALSYQLDNWLNKTDFSQRNLTTSNGDPTILRVVEELGLDWTTNTQTLWRIGAFGATIVLTILVILVMVFAKKIKIAIAIIEEASNAVIKMPCLACFPFFAAVFILANALFLVLSMSLLASADNVTFGLISDDFTNYIALNCSNLTELEQRIANGDGTVLDLLESAGNKELCSLYDYAQNWASMDAIAFLNWFQFFCFLWNNSVLQGISIMVVAGAVADWYWTRPSFDTSVKESDWVDQLEGARSFNGVPEGTFHELEPGRWDLMLNVNKILLLDRHVTSFDPDNPTHRQLLLMRGYETTVYNVEVPADRRWQGVGRYVRFNMSNLSKWKTGIRQGIEDEGEDPRAFYPCIQEPLHSCSKKRQRQEIGLRACLKPGRKSSPAWGDTDRHGVPVWKPNCEKYYARVQDPQGFYGPVDPDFGKLITAPKHQRLNNAYVHQMLTAGLLRKGGNGRDFRWPFAASLYRVFRFHLGSVCVGAFLIALVQFIRAVFSYIERSTRSWQNKNKCFACMFRVIHCVLCLLDKCMKFITTNAYIMVAMRGKPFCESCCLSFRLLLNNVAQFVIVGVFSRVVVFFGKAFVVILCCVATYVAVKLVGEYNDPNTETYVTNTFIPVTLTGIMAFGVASAFLHVYDLAIATILLCFCEDFRYHNVGDANRLKDHAEVYMPNSLRYILLDEDTRAKLPHPLTYEEVRAYSNSVHGVADHPHYHEEHPCNRTADAARDKVHPVETDVETNSAHSTSHAADSADSSTTHAPPRAATAAWE